MFQTTSTTTYLKYINFGRIKLFVWMVLFMTFSAWTYACDNVTNGGQIAGDEKPMRFL